MNNCYVYTLAYPDGTVFYVGKGAKYRINAHETEARGGVQSVKCDIIRQIWNSGGQVIKNKVHENLSWDEALEVERTLIAKYIPCGNKTTHDKPKVSVPLMRLRGDQARRFRQAANVKARRKLSDIEIEELASKIAHEAIDTFVKQKIEIEGAIIL